MMVTVCQPNAGYDYHAYGHDYCKEVAQETCYNVPVFTVVEPTVDYHTYGHDYCKEVSQETCTTFPSSLLSSPLLTTTPMATVDYHTYGHC